MREKPCSASRQIPVGVDEAGDGGVVVAGLQVVEPGLVVIVIATVAERIGCADGVAVGDFDAYALAPCIVQVLRNDLTRRCICKSDYIALQIIHVVSRDVTLLDADPRTGAVVEEPHHVATGLLREYLSAVEQILSLRAVHGLAASYPVRRVGVELAEDTVGN